mmetsp:Transcript_10887/g.16743  ORF Transcript_10887/g.16743 Transcript_10887/m.16743 type:complete len:338 (-) Transcript_10887:16-1029(-)
MNDNHAMSLRAPIILVALLICSSVMLWLGDTSNDELNHRRLQGSSIDPKTVEEKEPLVLPWKDDGKTIDLIVSLCKESVKPILELAQEFQVNRVFLYSKCGQNLKPSVEKELMSKGIAVNFQKLSNIGRESHTWLNHMLRSTTSSEEEKPFADWNLFIQAEPEVSIGSMLNAYNHVQSLDEDVNFADLSQYHSFICGRPVVLDESSKILTPQANVDDYNRYWCPWFQEFASYEVPCDTAKISLMGEFWASRDLMTQQAPKLLKALKLKFETTKTFREASDSVKLGHFLERYWINVLHAKDSCSVKEEKALDEVEKANEANDGSMNEVDEANKVKDVT